MAMLGSEELFVAFLLFVLIYYWRLSRHTLITNWPMLGMLPGLLLNLSIIFDYITTGLKYHGGNFMFHGPWLSNMNIFVTSDPMNVQHITSTKFENYGKGDDFREILEVLGDGIFRSDSELWKYNRSILHSTFKQVNFQLFIHKTIKNKIESCLLPFLDHAWKQGTEMDLQEAFQRLTYDVICSIVLGFDPTCLSIDFPEVASEKAFTEIEDALLYRHVMPRCLWKLLNWLQLGNEKKLKENQEIIDQMLYKEIKSRCKVQGQSSGNSTLEDEPRFSLLDVLTSKVGKGKIDDKFLRDTAMNLLAAGRDTISAGLTWFFWLVATHPSVESKILEEIREKVAVREGNGKDFGVEWLSKLTYLHAAITWEGQRKYGGEDCLKFIPERWISKRGEIIHMPSYKFIAFNAGPRSCLGKDISFTEMKMIAAAILWNYHIHLVDGHAISPRVSVILHMKHGLKVTLTKRSI
ncbi:Alkane hydroxylase [Vigna angularis]|uniref:Alkane hydroxylase n=1 Tax=Phaseolus angularis TaxID=3914 RepID=A0A8T0JSG2_PHAAN|nr:Alkane hydroxylase [Vigna angularis]